MSSAFDMGLDEILASKSKKNFRKKHISSKIGKKQPVIKKLSGNSVKKDVAPNPASVLDASYATKVIVYGLPKDIKQEAVKEFFASQVGGVRSVVLTYDEKGQSKGIATVMFKSSHHAGEAVKKYNGAPIDDGATKLKLELVIDPTKKPLATRIVANADAPVGSKKAVLGPKKDKNAPIKANKKPHKKSKRPPKKTLEQLDQEMADYFEKKE